MYVASKFKVNIHSSMSWQQILSELVLRKLGWGQQKQYWWHKLLLVERRARSFLPCMIALAIAITYGEPAKSGDIHSVQVIKKDEFGTGKISPPEAGVKLLEDIFQRLHNLPQLAMKKAKQTLAFQNQVASQIAQGPTDPLLAIKPKETPKKEQVGARFSNYSPTTIAMLPTSVHGKLLKEIAQERTVGEKREERKGLLRKDMKPRNEPEEALRDSEGASKQIRPSGSGYPPFSVQTVQTFSNSSNRGIQDGRIIDYRARQETQRTMSSAAGSSYRTTRQLEEVQRYAGGGGYSSQTISGKEAARLLSGVVDSSQSGRYGEYSRGQRLSDRPLVTEFSDDFRLTQTKKSRSQAWPMTKSNNAAVGSSLGANAGIQVPVSPHEAPPLYKNIREFAANSKNENAQRDKADVLAGASNEQGSYGDESSDGFSSNAYMPKQQRYLDTSSRLAEVALLPPSVITGIPLIRLGVSEREVTKALASRGSASKQLIGGWTVWSLSSSHSKEAVLQVYVRHGIVEAIRIFDTSLVSPELGLRLGDTLSAVKQRFGEPRFILSEPLSLSRHGQNYVYPISQVCFQLARVRSNSTPKVVSLLIFNVK